MKSSLGTVYTKTIAIRHLNWERPYGRNLVEKFILEVSGSVSDNSSHVLDALKGGKGQTLFTSQLITELYKQA